MTLELRQLDGQAARYNQLKLSFQFFVTNRLI
jgi:hypothetical protein